MNTGRRITDTLLDRLVDGELGNEEYVRLLAALDSEPDGWRRCATAFLEAQAWSQSLALPEVEPMRAVRPTATVSTFRTLCLVAGIAVAFFLGWQGAGWWTEDAREPNPGFVHSPRTQIPEVRQVQRGPQPVGNLTLVVDSGGQAEGQEVVVPVYDELPRQQRWLYQQTAMPPEVIRTLHSNGHRVRREQNWLPVMLEGADPMLVPIEEVEIVREGGMFYQ